MNRNLLLIPFLIFIAGCGPTVVGSTPHYETSRFVEDVQDCDAGGGFCYECGMGMNGWKCDYSYKFSCTGTQPVTKKVWDVTLRYSDGTTKSSTDSTVEKINGECKR